MTQNPKVKAVVFDLDGVYFETGTPEFKHALSEKFGIPEEEFVRVYLKSEEMFRYKKGEIDGETYWNWAIDEWTVDAKMEELVDLLIGSYTESVRVVRFVEHLREQGIKTAVCTNNFPERLNGLDRRFDFLKRFDVVVSSFNEGIMKPDPEMFNRLQQRLACEKAEIVMSDDKPENCEKLKEMGFEAIYYTDWDSFVGRLVELGVGNNS